MHLRITLYIPEIAVWEILNQKSTAICHKIYVILLLGARIKKKFLGFFACGSLLPPLKYFFRQWHRLKSFLALHADVFCESQFWFGKFHFSSKKTRRKKSFKIKVFSFLALLGDQTLQRIKSFFVKTIQSLVIIICKVSRAFENELLTCWENHYDGWVDFFSQSNYQFESWEKNSCLPLGCPPPSFSAAP